MVQNRQNIMREISQIIVDTSSKQRKEFREENMILVLCCQSPDAQPRVIAEQYNALIKDGNKTGNDIIRLFRACKLDRISERIELLKRSNHNAQKILNAMNQNDLSTLQSVKNDLDRHVQAKRLTLLALASALESELINRAYDSLLRMNRDFSSECLDTIFEYLMEGQSAPPAKTGRQAYLTAEDYEKEIYRLTSALNRANNLVARLQDSYEEQMIEIRADESIRMISMLNSEKYGYILDLLLSAQHGFRQLRKKGPIPFEIKSIQSLTRRLMEFVEDCGIVQILEIGERVSVQAGELDGYSYEGTPFTGPDEIKRVEVISPGWSVPEKDIVISYPRVKEITEEDSYAAQ